MWVTKSRGRELNGIAPPLTAGPGWVAELGALALGVAFLAYEAGSYLLAGSP